MVGESKEDHRENQEEQREEDHYKKEEYKEGDRVMDIRTWHFVLDVVSKCRDWIEEWMEVCPLKYELVPFDVHKDENLDFVCMVRVESTKEELSNLMFRGVNTIDGVKVTALQSFGED